MKVFILEIVKCLSLQSYDKRERLLLIHDPSHLDQLKNLKNLGFWGFFYYFSYLIKNKHDDARQIVQGVYKIWILITKVQDIIALCFVTAQIQVVIKPKTVTDTNDMVCLDNKPELMASPHLNRQEPLWDEVIHKILPKELIVFLKELSEKEEVCSIYEDIFSMWRLILSDFLRNLTVICNCIQQTFKGLNLWLRYIYFMCLFYNHRCLCMSSLWQFFTGNGC